jgi:trans-aconitate methyltransferase
MSGPRYLEYWRERMARGPDEAGFDGKESDRQGVEIWNFIEPHIKTLRPASLLEFGCGWGRMTRRLRSLWPDAAIHAVDLCEKALSSIRKEWREGMPPQLYTSIPEGLGVDLIFDCLAMQHVTDTDILLESVSSCRRALQPGGCVVLFENVSRPGADHMLDMDTTGYLSFWPEITWTTCRVINLDGQIHALMIGARR